jgi:extracellular elastinolytic metalloproteinase
MRRTVHRRPTLALAVVALVAAGTPAAIAHADLIVDRASAASRADHPATPASARGSADPSGEVAPYDARRVAAPRTLAVAADALRPSLGAQGVVSIDPLTGTPRSVARLDGLLTGPSSRPAATVALDYVAAHADVFGLSAADLAGLTPRRDYVDVAGTHHLSWTQQVGATPVVGNGLQANVTRAGELISVLGSPVPALAGTRLAAPTLTADAARRAASADLGTRAVTPGDAAPVAFAAPGGPRPAWRTVTGAPSGDRVVHVVDARTGAVLYRHSLTQHDSATTWDNYPGAAKGGTAKKHDLTAPGWLPAGAKTLSGNVAHVYSDVDDDDKAGPAEEIGPAAPGSFSYPFKPVAAVNQNCATAHPCGWDSTKKNSWQANRAQDAVQLLYFLGRFHDHLAAAPIGFTRAAGNFEAVDHDAVQAQASDGANTDSGRPDGGHINNANMTTPPDGQPPTMQMYLWHEPDDPTNRYVAANGGDEADIVYHEYTHGLSNRLVVDAAGDSVLDGIQSASMGEAWSDWFAMDFLAAEGLVGDTATAGEIRLGDYVSAGRDLIRSQPLDCPVGAKGPACPGSATAGAGGYTYGDFGRVKNHREVHADGEIWGETLWDLRTALGSTLTGSLVTRALELSPANPSFLDERNAILQADTVVNKGRARDAIWRVFANRGMGLFASSVDGDDVRPVEDFATVPAPGAPTATVTGVVTNVDTGKPQAGVTLSFGSYGAGYPERYRAVTDDQGRYTITGVPPGTYPRFAATAPGFDGSTGSPALKAGTNTVNWTVRRDWAAGSGGATVASHSGTDDGSVCSPDTVIDQQQTTSWDAATTIRNGAFTPQHLVIRLAQPVTVAELLVDPSGTCVHPDPSKSTKGYRIETSTDGKAWKKAATGRFGAADLGRLNRVPLAAGTGTAVRFVRYTMLSSQVPGDIAKVCKDFEYPGCQQMSVSEIKVYGS